MFGIYSQIFIFINVINLISISYCKIPDVILCAEETCTEPISEAQGKIHYAPPEKYVLAFGKGTKMVIISKTTDRDGYWGAKIGDKIGFVPSSLVKEVRVFKPIDKLLNSASSTIINNVYSKPQEEKSTSSDNIKDKPDDMSGDASERSPVEIKVTDTSTKEIPVMPSISLQNLVNQKLPEHNVYKNNAESNNAILESNTPPTQSDVNKINERHNIVGNDAVIDKSEPKNSQIFENSLRMDENIDNKLVSSTEELSENRTQGSAGFEQNEPLIEGSNYNYTMETVQSGNPVGSEGNKVLESNNVKNVDQIPNSNIQGGDTREHFVGSMHSNVIDDQSAEDGVNLVTDAPSSNENLMHNNINNNSNSSDDGNNNNNNNSNATDINSNDDMQVLAGDTLKSNDSDVNFLHLNDSTIDGINDTHVGVEISSDTDIKDSNKFPQSDDNTETEEESQGESGNDDVMNPPDSPTSEEELPSGEEEDPFLQNSQEVKSDDSPNELPNPMLPEGNGQLNIEAPHSDVGRSEFGKGSDVDNDSSFGSTENVMNDNIQRVVEVEGTILPYVADAADVGNTVPINDYPKESNFVYERMTEPFTAAPQTVYTSDSYNQQPSTYSEKPSDASQLGSIHSFDNTESYISEATERSAGENDFAAEKTDRESTQGNIMDAADNYPSEGSGGDGFLSKINDYVLGWFQVRSKSDEEEKLTDGGNFESEISQLESGGLVQGESCQSVDGSVSACGGGESPDGSASIWNFWASENKPTDFASSYNTFVYLVVTAVTVLLFTLGYYFIEKFQNDGHLIAKVNRLERELQISSKECIILKDELQNTKEKLNLFETSSNDKIIAALQLEKENFMKTKAELEHNIEVLQQELEAATEAGLDLDKMLSEVLTQKGGSETLMESVEQLQSQLNNQQNIIDEMTTKLVAKTKENQELQDELASANEKVESLEGEVEDMRNNANSHMKDNEDVISDLSSKNNELQMKLNELNENRDKNLKKMKSTISDLEKKYKSALDSLKVKEGEFNNLKESVKKMKLKDSKSMDSLFDVSRVKAELAQSESEVASLKENLKVEERKRLDLENNMKNMDEEIKKLREFSQEAEKEKGEAQTRLEVLSNYFKEKETQLQKELGLREAMWVQKQGDDSTIYERMKSLEEEINNYKSQNEALRKEILDQERGLKAQITTLEKKAHENWIAARQAERKLEEHKQEAGQLRNKLTLMEKSMTNDLDGSQHHRTNEEINGSDAISPLLHDASSPILFPPPLPLDPNNSLMPPGFMPPPMFMPPPPGGFMPPPPPFMPGDHRPPPLGRMSSPPLNSRFSPPPPPDYTYERMSTPPLSPSNRNYRSPNEAERDRFRHRTPTSPSFRSRNWEESATGFRPISSERDSRRDHKGGSNLSSGHSSDSLDKSSRHSGRV